MLQRQREERLEGKMFFWGKVEGDENDYLVCYVLATPKLEEGEFPLKKVGEFSVKRVMEGWIPMEKDGQISAEKGTRF